MAKHSKTVGTSAKLGLVLTLLVAAQMWGQVAGGTIQGTITDDSGAILQNATVVITRTASGVSRTATTNGDGFYIAANLLPGVYEMTVAATGFANLVRKDITLTVGSVEVVNLALHVGKVTENVEVTGVPPAVELATSSLSGVVSAGTVRQLPLNGRDWTSLATLEPGVSSVLTQSTLAAGDTNRVNRGYGAQLTVGGTRPEQNNYRVDGISVNDYANAAPGGILGTNLGVDAIQEFSVITSNAPADYGKNSGGVINAITRSGTNKFHGSAYEFFRNSALDARNFFDGPQVPAFKQNQFGASAGGPIVKNRTFIFGDYEGVRESLGATSQVFVPSPAARTGQLKSGKVTVSPKVLPFLNLYPLPNGPVNGDTGLFNFVSNSNTHENYFTTRADHTISSKDFLHGTYLFDTGQSQTPDSADSLLVGTIMRRQFVALEETHIFSPSFLNSVRFGFSRTVADAPKVFAIINPLVADTSLGFSPGVPPGQIVVSGLETLNGGPGGQGEFIYHYNSFQEYDDASLTRGKHALQFGGSLERVQANDLGSSRTLGRFQFGSIASFLTNKPTSFVSNATPFETPRNYRQLIAAAYVQDNWRLRSNLTLNIGLRYEMATVPIEVNNKLATLANITDPTPKIGSPYFQNPTLRNFEPRIGFSWDPFGSGKTAVRAAFGIYDVLPLHYLVEVPIQQVAPFHLEGLNSNLPTGAFPLGGFPLSLFKQLSIEQNPSRSYVEQWNLNIQRQLTRSLAAVVGYIGSAGIHNPFAVPDKNIVLPTSTPRGYLWPAPAGSGTVINPKVGTIIGVGWPGRTSYNGLQVKLTEIMAKRLQVQGSYTWSKNIDTSSSAVNGNTFLNSVSELPFFDTRLSRALSDFDVRHNLAVSYLWQLPGPPSSFGAAGWVIRGWNLGGILKVRSGIPFTPTIGGDPLGLKNSQPFAFPNRLTGPGCESAVNPGSVNYVKTQCFTFPVPSTLLGNARRNSLIGPGLIDYDASLLKDSPIKGISEQFDIQFQAQFFNVLNHTNLAVPSSGQIFNATGGLLSSAGVITSTDTTSRQIQFSLKVIW